MSSTRLQDQQMFPGISAMAWADTYGIQHWETFKSSYWKLAGVEFEPTTTQFCSDALTD